MTALHLLYLVASSLVVLALLFFGTFGLLFCERFVQARTQHRDGPGRGGKIDYLQVWTDFLKVRRKSGHAQQIISGRFRAIFAIWIFLPMLFLLVLLAPIIPEQVASAELPIMLVLPLIAAGIEALFIHATSDARERYDWRKHLMLRVMGATVLYLSVAAVGLRVGHSNLEAISDLQSRFPFHSILSSPGLLLCGLGAFSAIFIFAAESPVEGRLEMSLNRSMQYVLFFVNKMWIFCLLCFWVFLFLEIGRAHV